MTPVDKDKKPAFRTRAFTVELPDGTRKVQTGVQALDEESGQRFMARVRILAYPANPDGVRVISEVSPYRTSFKVNPHEPTPDELSMI